LAIYYCGFLKNVIATDISIQFFSAVVGSFEALAEKHSIAPSSTSGITKIHKLHPHKIYCSVSSSGDAVGTLRRHRKRSRRNSKRPPVMDKDGGDDEVGDDSCDDGDDDDNDEEYITELPTKMTTAILRKKTNKSDEYDFLNAAIPDCLYFARPTSEPSYAGNMSYSLENIILTLRHFS